MTSKNWLSAFGPACATISLLLCGAAAASAQTPAIALIEPADAPQWQTWAKETGWRVVTGAAAANPDARVLALAAAVQRRHRQTVSIPRVSTSPDAAAAAAGVFYAISRMPDLLGRGDRDRRLSAAGHRHRPHLRRQLHQRARAVGQQRQPGDQALAAKLKSDGLNVEWRAAAGLSPAAFSSGSASTSASPSPPRSIAKPTSPAIRALLLDSGDEVRRRRAQRRPALHAPRWRARSPRSTSAASGTKPTSPAPACSSPSSPRNINGPLKMGDRIVATRRPSHRDAEAISRNDGEVHRGEARRGHRAARQGARPRRDADRACRSAIVTVTARVQGQYLPADNEIQIVSRTITEMKRDHPAAMGAGQPPVMEWPRAGENRSAGMLGAHRGKGIAACRALPVM